MLATSLKRGSAEEKKEGRVVTAWSKSDGGSTMERKSPPLQDVLVDTQDKQ